MLDIMQMIANRNNNERDDHNTILDSTAKTQQTGHKKNNGISKQYPTLTHSLITFFFNLSYLTRGDLAKIRPKRPIKFGRNYPGPTRPKRPGPKRPRAETTEGRNDSGSKRPGTFVSRRFALKPVLPPGRFASIFAQNHKPFYISGTH